MEDMIAKLQEVLSSDEGKQKLANIASMMTSQDGGLDLSAVSSMLGKSEPSPTQEDGGIDLNAMLKIGKMLSSVSNREDINTNLIRAIKPHLKGHRREKADEVIKIMKLMSLVPLLSEAGIFELGGGENRKLLK